MPYFIQFVRDLSTRVEKVQKSTDDIKKKEEVKAEEEANRPLDLDMHFMFPGMRDPMGGMGAAPLSIMPAAGSMPGMGMGGFSAGPAGFGGGMSAFQTAPTGLGSFGTMNGMQSGFNTQQRF
jgi:hypothetical protein